MKKKGSVRVKAERGYGPRHMMNAQEGSDAVPSALPTPDDYSGAPGYAKPVLDALKNAVIPPEDVATIRNDPGSLAGAQAIVKAIVSGATMMGGEGELKAGGSVARKAGNVFLKAIATRKAGDAADEAAIPELPAQEIYPRAGYKRGTKKVAVAKGFGPMHAENAKEGEPVDLTKIDTDTVDAKLTPREAVLNRNASELAGRDNIEKLNAEGNQLARKGVDLAAGGMTSVKEKIMKSKPQSGSPYVQAFQKLMPKQPAGYEQGVGGVPSPMPPYSTSGGGRPAPAPNAGVRPMPRPGGGMPDPLQHQGGFNMANINQAAAGLPVSMGGSMQPPAPIGGPYGGTLGDPRGYPVGIGHGYAGGSAEVAQGPIGTPPQGEQAYGPPVNLTAPQIMAAAKQAGLSQGQLAGLMKAFQGGQQAYSSIGSGGTPSAADMFSDAGAGYQGGISDIGYPPFVAPSANYDGNRGGWLGPYDPSFMIQRYARGISSVPFR